MCGMYFLNRCDAGEMCSEHAYGIVWNSKYFEFLEEHLFRRCDSHDSTQEHRFPLPSDLPCTEKVLQEVPPISCCPYPDVASTTKWWLLEQKGDPSRGARAGSRRWRNHAKGKKVCIWVCLPYTSRFEGEVKLSCCCSSQVCEVIEVFLRDKHTMKQRINTLCWLRSSLPGESALGSCVPTSGGMVVRLLWARDRWLKHFNVPRVFPTRLNLWANENILTCTQRGTGVIQDLLCPMSRRVSELKPYNSCGKACETCTQYYLTCFCWWSVPQGNWKRDTTPWGLSGYQKAQARSVCSSSASQEHQGDEEALSVAGKKSSVDVNTRILQHMHSHLLWQAFYLVERHDKALHFLMTCTVMSWIRLWRHCRR